MSYAAEISPYLGPNLAKMAQDDYEQREQEQAAENRRRQIYESEFLLAFLRCPHEATTDIDGLREDWRTKQKVYPTLDTVIYETLECADIFSDVTKVIANSAKAGNLEALQVIKKLSMTFADIKIRNE